MEFKLISPLNDTGFIQKIEFNFDELKSELTRSLEKYKNLVYTDAQLKEAKTDRAGLNKFREILESERKRIKKLCLKPYEEFEARVKELVALIDEPILAIDTQIKAQEDKRAEAKKAEIEEFFNQAFGSLKEFVTLEKIFDEKWLNVTYSMSKVRSDITKLELQITTEVQTIKDLNLPIELSLQVMNKYLENLSLTEALEEKTRLEELQKKLEGQNPPSNPQVEAKNPQVTHQVTLKFWAKGTREQLLDLKAFMEAQGIKFGSIIESEK